MTVAYEGGGDHLHLQRLDYLQNSMQMIIYKQYGNEHIVLKYRNIRHLME
jgi:hypothetical protein